jgi:uncharacterized protein
LSNRQDHPNPEHFMRALVLITALTALTLPAAAQAVAPLKPYDPAVVRVAGRAELYLPPDQARVSVSFYNPGKTAAEATDAAASRARALETAIRQLGAEKVRLERADTNVRPVMQAGGDRRPDRIKGYEATVAVTVLVNDLALLSKTVEAAVNAQPDTFNDVSFAIRDTLAARRKAREAAIADAVDKAKVYTEGAGHRLGRLLEVQEGGSQIMAQSGNRAIMRAVPAMMESDSVSPPPVVAEAQLYTAEVAVVYEIGAALAPR